VIIIILIIAEKPSLARNISSALGKFTNKQGWMENPEYIVTWAFGHLFSLADIEEYSPNPDGNRWSMKNIPCFPEEFRFELKKDKNKQVDAGVLKQFNVINSLCNDSRVDTIVNAGDSDREGEIIIRICVEKANPKNKSFKRLWLPDQTAETIRAAIAEMKDEAEYENLANEGFARTYIDWLYGVNLTRYATLKTGTLLRVGRVIVPIVKAIYDRDLAIRNFVPELYYQPQSKAVTNGEEIELTSKEKFSKDKLYAAKALCDKYNSLTTTVASKKKKKETLNPGKLYSLSKLQGVLGKKFKMSMADSLKAAQSLYEKGYITYPRTNSEYLSTNEQDKMKNIISAVSKIGYPVEFKFKKTIFDDSKIESHSALTPTHKIPDKSKLTEDELKTYSTIMRRFVAVFCSEECKAEKTEITIDLSGVEEFTLKGTVITEPGWTKYDDYTKKDKILPKLEKGDTVNVNFVPVEKHTTPPKHYTIETLNSYLKNPFREEKADTENDDEDYKAMFEGLELGTEATRTGIIDNARNSGYIELKKDTYYILPAGEYMIEALTRMNISMDKFKTAEVGKALKKVFRGEFTIKESIETAKSEIKAVFDFQNPDDDGFAGDYIGKCPICGNNVVKGRFGYGCMGYKEGCKFRIGNVICKKLISKSNAAILVQGGTTPVINGFISKNGKEFSAKLKLENDKIVFDFS